MLADPVADPFGATGHHDMGYGDEAHSYVVSQDTLTADGGRLTLAPFDPAPATTGIAADQMLLEAWIEPNPGGVAPRAMVLYGLGVGGWNPYVTVDAASILAYLETTTDYTVRRPAGPADVRIDPHLLRLDGQRPLHRRRGRLRLPGQENPAYEGEIECTFTGTLECETLSDDGVLRPGTKGKP